LKNFFKKSKFLKHFENPSDTVDEWLCKLHKSGYRMTIPRRAIVEILVNADYLLGPNEVFESGRKKYPGLGLVTVYRTLEKLETLGLIQRVHQPSGCNMYLRAGKGHQHLLLCTSCGRAEFFSGDDLSDLFNKTAKINGFTIQDHWLQVNGKCPECQLKEIEGLDVKKNNS